MHVKLGIDPRHADQQVRGVVVLPNGTGKTVRVLAICKGAKADEAQAAGADFVGGEEMVQKIQQENWFDYDVIVTTPDMMGVVGRLGKVLGPKGLMPNPKSGTVTMDITRAIHDIKAGKVEYRVDKQAICHVPFGKASFGVENSPRTSTLLWTLSSKQNRQQPKASISDPSILQRRWDRPSRCSIAWAKTALFSE